MTAAPPCLHCQTAAEVRLVKGSKIYPTKKYLHHKKFWLCSTCGAYCGCHDQSFKPLGYPADYATRQARSRLHNERLDPLWRSSTKGKRAARRTEVYSYLSIRMGLNRDDTHIGMFTLEQCRAAWRLLGKFKSKI